MMIYIGKGLVQLPVKAGSYEESVTRLQSLEVTGSTQIQKHLLMNRHDITQSNKQICFLAVVCHTGVFDNKWNVALEQINHYSMSNNSRLKMLTITVNLQLR